MEKEKVIIKWELNCNAKDALHLLSQSLEFFLLPWFMTKTSVKGFIYKNKFIAWPNTFFSAPTQIMLTGEIVQNGNNSTFVATARLLPPFNLFPMKQSINWISGTTMVFAWLGIVACLVLGKEYLIDIFMTLFLITCVYNLIQFSKYIQKPELADFEKHIYKIFKNNISNV